MTSLRADARPIIDLGQAKRSVLQLTSLRRSPTGTFLSSDRGVEYLADEIRRTVKRADLQQSMNQPRRMPENAQMDSWFKPMKSDLYRRQAFHNGRILRNAIRTYVDFYNRVRLHSALG